MTSKLAAALLAVLAAPAFAADPPPPPPAPPAPKMSAAECEVWNRERSFARSVDEHDTAAFKAHVHPGAVFFGGPNGRHVGRDGVAEGWKEIIAGGAQSLHWYPRQATIGGDPGVAHSIGPFWIEDTTPDAKERYLTGQFISIWTKVDGEWMVLFDGGGGGRPQPATKEQVDALKASLAPECPRA
jgi:ketosteroid isomerase-like protein